MRTRASAPVAEQPDSSEKTSKSPATAVKPTKTFILPSAASQDARFVTLPNPRTGELSRYFFCPKLGVYEFTVVASTPQLPRSILYTPKSTGTTAADEDDKANPASEGTISKTAQLLIATPIDVIFFMIPLLSSPSPQAKKLFQPLDDIIDSHDELPKHLRYVLYNDSFRELLHQRVEAVCDSVEAGDEKLFRLSETKVLKELLTKAERMVAQGLPPSLEERFIKQALAAPLMSVARDDVNANNGAATSSTEAAEESESQSSEGKDTQSTTTTATTTTTSSTSASTPLSEPTPVEEQLPEQPTCPPEIIHLRRISTALSFMKESYIAQDLCVRFDEILAACDSPLDFKLLQDHLKHLANLRAEALASRSLGDFSRKRTLEDDEAVESRAEKKRRKEEEEKKKKAGESRGVRDLKKVNTTGMKKMSDFFAKAAPKKKP